MQNNVQISAKWSKSKVDFQYGGRFFLKNGSSYISAINWYVDEIWFWFAHRLRPFEGSDINNAKPEIVFSRRGCHLHKAR